MHNQALKYDTFIVKHPACHLNKITGNYVELYTLFKIATMVQPNFCFFRTYGILNFLKEKRSQVNYIFCMHCKVLVILFMLVKEHAFVIYNLTGSIDRLHQRSSKNSSNPSELKPIGAIGHKI